MTDCLHMCILAGNNEEWKTVMLRPLLLWPTIQDAHESLVKITLYECTIGSQIHTVHWMDATYTHFFHQDRNNKVLICNTACMYCRLPNTTHPHFAHYIKANMGRGCLLKCSITPPPPHVPHKVTCEVDDHNDWPTRVALLNVYYVHRKPVALVLILNVSREILNQLRTTVSAWC